MIERLYIDNVRSFVSFEWRPDRLALLLGPNGSGKTTLFETLFALRGFVTGECSVGEAFPVSSRTRWDRRITQTIELEVRAAGGLYRYRLVVQHDPPFGYSDPLVASESLSFDERSVVEFKTGDLTVYRGDQAQAVPGARPTRSGVGALDPRSGEFLGGFQDWMRNLWLLRPDPRAMSARVDRQTTRRPWLLPDLSNFASWYPPTFASQPRDTLSALRALEQTLPGLVEIHDAQGTLEARFERGGVTSNYSFEELSDGERSLVALYVILHVVAGPGKVLLLDEPDNYLGLREIQPWLAELADLTLRSDGPQALLISHHPEALNFLAPERGFRMFRDDNGPTRIEKFEVGGDLDPAEAVARGWDSST